MAAELRKLGAGVVEGADFIEVTPPESSRRRAIHTYDDHRVAMCAFAGGLRRRAGAHPRPEVRRQDLPDYFEALFDLVRTSVEAVPVITVDGPTASGRARSPARCQGAGLPLPRFRRRLPRHRADRDAHRRGERRRSLAGSHRRDAAAAFHRRRCPPGDENVADALRAEDVGAMASKVCLAGRARGAAPAAAGRSGAFRAWWPTGATWAR